MSFLRPAIISLLYIILLASYPSTVVHSSRPSTEYKSELNTSIDNYPSTNVTVYLLNLPGIPSSMGNTSRFLEGIRDATQDGTFGASNAYGALPGTITQGFQTSVMFRFVQVSDWTSYKQIILNANNFVLINSHGNYLPVPQGYLPSQWFEQILNAISNHYGTWVHIAGFPFYIAWGENSGIIAQGPSLFQRLAAYAGWSATIDGNPSRAFTESVDYFYHIARWPKLLANETSWNSVDYGTKVTLSSYTNYTLDVLDPGPGFHGFYKWTENFAGDQCSTCRVYYSGVAAQVNGTNAGRYGLYVHFVPQVFGNKFVTNTGIDHDYGTGLLSVLIALEWQIEDTLNAIRLAEGNIAGAEFDMRTQGLDVSRNLVSDAKSEFQLGRDLQAWSTANAAAVSANDATVPWLTALWTQGWPYIALIGGIAGISLAAALGTIIPSVLAGTVGRLGNRIGWVERASGFLRKKLSRFRRSKDEDVL